MKIDGLVTCGVRSLMGGREARESVDRSQKLLKRCLWFLAVSFTVLSWLQASDGGRFVCAAIYALVIWR